MYVSDHKRLFIAVFPDSEVMDNLESTAAQLARLIPPGAIRWAAREQFHLTLNFLGDIRTARIPELD
ncbi:MAG: 2'-5' RNA ligase family protein, partial [Candidatus Acidiferrales bacterium]